MERFLLVIMKLIETVVVSFAVGGIVSVFTIQAHAVIAGVMAAAICGVTLWRRGF